MWQCCQYLYNHVKLIFQIYSYTNYLEENQEHSILYLDQICETIQSCGSVAIKFCQWITPKLELMHTEENDLIDKDRVKPLWLRKLEIFYEKCNEHSTEYTLQEYERVFGEHFNDKYEILDIIGSGSIGQVYLIQDKPLKDYTARKKYVMKIIHPNVKYEINFFRRFYNLICKCPCIKNKIRNTIPFDILAFIDQFEEQSNFILESNNLLKFQEAYKDNELIVIPRLIDVSQTIMIMSHEPGESFEECKLNKYQKGKFAMLFGLFMRNNQSILNYNHGDLHKGNWKIRKSDEDDNHKLVIYDFGFCWSVPRDLQPFIELTYDTFENSDKEHQELQNIADIMGSLVTYDRNDKAEFRKRVDLFVQTNYNDLMAWCFSPVKLFKSAVELCLLERILLNPIMIQTIVLAIQMQLLLQEYGLQSTAKKEIKSYEVYRGRYIDFLTFCKTKDIFHDYQKNIENKLNEKQTDVKGLFDFIDMPDSIKALALAK